MTTAISILGIMFCLLFLLPYVTYSVSKWSSYGFYAGKSLWNDHSQKYKQ